MMDPIWRPAILTVFDADNESVCLINPSQIIRLQTRFGCGRAAVPRGTWPGARRLLGVADVSGLDAIVPAGRAEFRELRMQSGHDELHGLRGDFRDQAGQALVTHFRPWVVEH